MAKAYIKLGDKAKAWKSLQDAIKCNYDQWQVWDNLMIVSIDLRHFSEVRIYLYIIKIKRKLNYFVKYIFSIFFQFFNLYLIFLGNSMLSSYFRFEKSSFRCSSS